MFLYWKKRGAYELEALPPSLAQVGMERYSWSSSLDVIHDLCGKLGYCEGHLTKAVGLCLFPRNETGGWGVAYK